MQYRIITLFPILATSLIVAVGLASPVIAGSDKEFGCTVKQNIEVQTIDMDPKYAGTLVEGGVGKRSSDAVRRYMTDKVRPLIRFDGRTQVGAQGGSASPGGGN